jgi:hypothetical protein
MGCFKVFWRGEIQGWFSGGKGVRKGRGFNPSISTTYEFSYYYTLNSMHNYQNQIIINLN